MYSKDNDNGNADDILYVDHFPSSCTVGDDIDVFNHSTSESTVLKNIFPSRVIPMNRKIIPVRVEVSDISNFSSYDQYWGIRTQDNAYTYSLITDDLFRNAYGLEGNGTDGGTFLKLKAVNSNINNKIPNGFYDHEVSERIAPLATVSGQKLRPLELFPEFCTFWSTGADFKNDNHWHLIASDQTSVGATAVTMRTDPRIGPNNFGYMGRPDLQNNRSFVFNRNHPTVLGPPSPEFEISKQETMAHEFGHIFVLQQNNGITHNHFHGFKPPPSLWYTSNVPATHLWQDACIMTIDNVLRDRTNQIVEFDHLYSDPSILNQGSSCHRIIRSMEDKR